MALHYDTAYGQTTLEPHIGCVPQMSVQLPLPLLMSLISTESWHVANFRILSLWPFWRNVLQNLMSCASRLRM